MLLSKFSVNIEQEGDVKFDGYLIEGASALWVAAGCLLIYYSECQIN
jgi:Fem-1 family protein b